MKCSITTYPSLLAFLDTLVSSVPWDDFYTSRRYPAPFILQNESPDENLVAFLTENKTIKTALELGCGVSVKPNGTCTAETPDEKIAPKKT